MARAETPTKLSLDRFAQIVGIHPLHFNGVFVRAPTVCEQPFLQFAFQTSDRIGREDLAQAISQAEGDIERELGYRLMPAWEVDEWRDTPRPFRPELFNLSHTDIRGFGPIVEANWGYLVSGGIRSKTLVAADVPVTFSDEDGDGYAETATVTVTVNFASPCEVYLYFPNGGPVPDSALDEWEIRPIKVTISGTTATIKLRREQLVKPELQSDIVPPTDDSHLRGIDGLVDANFAVLVDVYRVYNDPQRQVQFLWEPLGCSQCNSSGCGNCAYSAQTGCLLVRGDPRHSIVSFAPANWNATTLVFDSTPWAVGREPSLVRLWYYAGWRNKSARCPTLQMDPIYERMVAYYAASLLERPVCSCNNVTAYIDHWQRDLAIPGEEGLQISPDNLDNPFGTRRGAIFAWKRLDNFLQTIAK